MTAMDVDFLLADTLIMSLIIGSTSVWSTYEHGHLYIYRLSSVKEESQNGQQLNYQDQRDENKDIYALAILNY
jgi:hypothetical protein